ncbi:MAG TPA: hypothetical protein VKF63_00880 [Terracidiphilus sp.]|nr:hypothetical protein [Terracidiphilus sp.]
MLAARAGSGQGLISNNSFADLVNGARPDAPIWGHAESSAAAEWMRASIPGQDSMQMNWSRLLSGVDSLAYAIKPGEKVHLQMTFSCKSQAAAADLRLLLDGLRLVEKMAWLGKNPKAPNPFENVELDSSGDSVELQLDTPAPTT